MNDKKIQLFCIPFAGGSASAFNELCTLLDERIDVHVIEYPGRGTRKNDPFCNTMDDLIEDAKRQVEEKRNKELPFSILGYSMGVEVAFDLGQFELNEKPVHLFFAAREAICYDTKGHDYSLLKMDSFIDKIVSLGGIDERILNNRRFLEIYMRPIYADYKLLYQYIYKKERGQLNSNVTVFYCGRDTPFIKVKDWSEFTTFNTDFFELGNNHFFIQQHAQDMADIINHQIIKYI